MPMLPSQDVLPGLSAAALEDLKKERVSHAIEFDAKIHRDARLSIEEFIKQEEAFIEFIQQQMDDKTKADKDAAREDAAAQQKTLTEPESAVQAELARNAALVMLLKELLDLEKNIATQKKELTTAHQQSESTLKKITDQILDVVGKQLSQENQNKFQKAYAKQQERKAAPAYIEIQAQTIREVQKTYEGLSEVKKKVADNQVIHTLANQQILMLEIIAQRFLNQDQPNAKQQIVQLAMAREAEKNAVRLEQCRQMDGVYQKAESESINFQEIQQRTDIIDNETAQKIQKIENQFKDAMLHLKTTYAMNPSAENAAKLIFGNLSAEKAALITANTKTLGAIKEIDKAEAKLETKKEELVKGLAPKKPSR